MVTAIADGSNLRRSARLKEEIMEPPSQLRRSRRFEPEEESESDGDPDFNHKEFEWLYKLPRKPKSKTYVDEGLFFKPEQKPKRSFQFPFVAKQRSKAVQTQRDFKLPPNIWQPLYALTSVNGWKSLARNAWTKEALDIYDNIVEHVPECVCEEDCDEDCLNRASKIECDTLNCPFTYCTNRAFQQHTQLPPAYVPTKNSEYAGGRVLYSRGYEVFATGPKGFGLRACREYAPHELIVEYTGEVITNDEMAHRMSTIYAHTRKYYCLSFVNGLVIDSGRKGSEARYVNHSCKPNCEMQKWYVKGTPRIGLFVGDEPIPAGTELAYDYNFDIFKGAIGQKCYCGEPNCRGIIGKRFPKKDSKKKKLKIRIPLKGLQPVKPSRPRKKTPYTRTKPQVPPSPPSPQEVVASVPRVDSSLSRAERARLRAAMEPISHKNIPRMRRPRCDRAKRQQEEVQKQETLANVQAEFSLNVGSLLHPVSPDSSVSSGYHTFEEEAEVPSSHTSAQESDIEFLQAAGSRSKKVPDSPESEDEEEEEDEDDQDEEEEQNDEEDEVVEDNDDSQDPNGQSGDDGPSDEGSYDEEDSDDDEEEEESESESESDSEHQQEEFFPTKKARRAVPTSSSGTSSKSTRRFNYSKGRPRLTDEQKEENKRLRDDKRKNSETASEPIAENSSRSLRHRRRAGDENEFAELPATKRVRRKKIDEEPEEESGELERQQFLEENMKAGEKLTEALVKDDNKESAGTAGAGDSSASTPVNIPRPVEPINKPANVSDKEFPPKPIPSVMAAFNRSNYMDRHFNLGDRLAETVADKPASGKPATTNSVATAPSPSPPQASAKNANSNNNSARPTNVLSAAEVAATFNRPMQIPIQAMTTVPARITPAIPTQTRRHPTSPRNSQRMEVRLPANNNPPSSVPAHALNQIQHAQAQQQPPPTVVAQQPQPMATPQQVQMPYMFMNSFQMGNQMMMPQFPVQFAGQMQQPVAMQTPQGTVMMVQPQMMMMPQNQRPVQMQFPQQVVYASPQPQQPQVYGNMTPQYNTATTTQFVQHQFPQSQPQTPVVLPNGQQVVFQSAPAATAAAPQEQVPTTPTPQQSHTQTPILGQSQGHTSQTTPQVDNGVTRPPVFNPEQFRNSPQAQQVQQQVSQQVSQQVTPQPVQEGVQVQQVQQIQQVPQQVQQVPQQVTPQQVPQSVQQLQQIPQQITPQQVPQQVAPQPAQQTTQQAPQVAPQVVAPPQQVPQAIQPQPAPIQPAAQAQAQAPVPVPVPVQVAAPSATEIKEESASATPAPEPAAPPAPAPPPVAEAPAAPQDIQVNGSTHLPTPNLTPQPPQAR